MNGHPYTDIISGSDLSMTASLSRAALAGMTPGYRAAVAVRNRMFDMGLRRVTRLSRPTISVGNLTAGGTGKTPMTRRLFDMLTEQGHRPAVLLRGYSRDGQPSDEAAEYEAIHIPVQVDVDRTRAANRVLEGDKNVDVFLLDDGFQHRQVYRDLDLVLIDATQPFGHGHMLPRGLLREPMANLRRADAVIVTRADQIAANALAALDRRIVELTGKPPLAHCRHAWTRWRGLSAEQLRTMPVMVLAGIGNPHAFAQQVEPIVGRIVERCFFPDHYAYSEQDANRLREQALEQDAQAVVTTMKDWVKLRQGWSDADGKLLPVAMPEVGMTFMDGQAAVAAVLREVIADVSDAHHA